jgi:hypothetical protein
LIYGAGNLVHGLPVNVATPARKYSPSVPVDPALPPHPILNPVVQAAQVVAAILARVAPTPNGLHLGFSRTASAERLRTVIYGALSCGKLHPV